MREHGYDSATMDRIADEVGLNKGTLYHYYPSKSTILYELLSDQLDATLDLIGQVPAEGTATDRLREFLRLQVEHVSTKQDELVVFFQEIPWIGRHLPADQVASLRERVDRYEKFTRKLLNSGIRSGEFRKLNVTMALHTTVGVLAYVPNWFRATDRRSRTALVDELTEFVLSAVVRGGT